MNNGWIKHFADGKTEVGFDHLVRGKHASWQKGRLDNLVSVEIRHNDLGAVLSCEGNGEWWQSDSMLARYVHNGTSPLIFTTRRIMRRITNEDAGKNLYIYRPSANTSVYTITNDCWAQIDMQPTMLIIQPEQIGSWFIVSLDLERNGIVHHFSDKRK